jgi:hypothetical protein
MLPAVTGRAIALLGFTLALACDDPAPTPTPEVEDRTLQLSVDVSAVEPRLGEVGVLSVEVYGLRQTTSLCTLARRCLYPLDLGSPQDGEQLQAALRSVQPLVEVDAENAHQIAVVARSGGLCDEQGPFLLCGFADIGTASGDELTIALAEGQCPQTLPEFCPP